MQSCMLHELFEMRNGTHVNPTQQDVRFFIDSSIGALNGHLFEL